VYALGIRLSVDISPKKRGRKLYEIKRRGSYLAGRALINTPNERTPRHGILFTYNAAIRTPVADIHKYRSAERRIGRSHESYQYRESRNIAIEPL